MFEQQPALAIVAGLVLFHMRASLAGTQPAVDINISVRLDMDSHQKSQTPQLTSQVAPQIAWQTDPQTTSAGMPTTTTAALQTGSSKVRSLAYQLFDGINAKFKYCKLKDEQVIESLPSTKWQTSTQAPIFYGVHRKTTDQVNQSYTYVPGDALQDAEPPYADLSNRYMGLCYRMHGSKRITKCVCGAVGLKGADLSWAATGKSLEDTEFSGCQETKPLPMSDEGASELKFGESITTRVIWAQPFSLWVEAAQDSWCELRLQLKSKEDNSVAHALPYCVVAEYQQENQNEAKLYGKQYEDILYHLYWAASYDQESSTGWFKASQLRFKTQWELLASALRKSTPEKRNRFAVLREGRRLCWSMYNLYPGAWDRTKRVYQQYMEKVNIEKAERRNISDGLPPSGQKPLFVIAAGPPSSGKSITSMSSLDFNLIMQKTRRSGDAHFAFNERSYDGFQAGTVELNVDRIVEATDLSNITKAHMAIRSGWVEEMERTQEAHKKMAKLQQDVGQREYWFLRKAAKIDDLSNVHIQRTLAMGQDCIYETLLGDGWLDWALKFELPKVRAAGYEVVLVNYIVPVKELVHRAFEREKQTGQTPAPAKQIEADAVAAPTNFMKPELLKMIDYGISMSHVRRGETEDALAVFRNRDGEACFTHCADDAMLDTYKATMLKRCEQAKCAQ